MFDDKRQARGLRIDFRGAAPGRRRLRHCARLPPHRSSAVFEVEHQHGAAAGTAADRRRRPAFPASARRNTARWRPAWACARHRPGRPAPAPCAGAHRRRPAKDCPAALRRSARPVADRRARSTSPGVGKCGGAQLVRVQAAAWRTRPSIVQRAPAGARPSVLAQPASSSAAAARKRRQAAARRGRGMCGHGSGVRVG